MDATYISSSVVQVVLTAIIAFTTYLQYQSSKITNHEKDVQNSFIADMSQMRKDIRRFEEYMLKVEHKQNDLNDVIIDMDE